jgi:tRNA threonylcarbamoyladenosine biosynthesis protein TsaB
MNEKDLRILAIDTSSKVVSIAVVSWNGPIFEEYVNIEDITCSEIIIRLIDRALKGCGISLSDIDGFGVGCGPGSFTGIRIGIGTIKGLAFTCRRPAVAIPSIDALSMNVPRTERLICSMIDARMGEVYAALYKFENGKDLKRITDIWAIRPSLLIDKIREDTIFVGNGALLYRKMIEDLLREKASFLPDEFSFPKGSIIGDLALKEIASGNGKDAREILPIYIRPSQAEIRWGDGWFKRRLQ